MNEKYIKFVDFIFDEMKSEYGKWFDFSSLSYEFEKLHGIKIDYRDQKYIEDKFSFDLFDKLGETIKFKLSSHAHDIIHIHGSYSYYLKSEAENNNRQKEIQDLSFKVNQLQANNLEFEKSNQALKTENITLDNKVKKWGLFKTYWWISAGIFSFLIQIIIEVATSRELVLSLIRQLINLI